MTFLAGDWGSTHLTCWHIDDAGRAGPPRRFDLGIARLASGEAARLFQSEVRPAMSAEGESALLCGMIGSDRGWRQAPYLPCPAKLEQLASALVEAAPGVRIAPGLRCEGPFGPDVMRGEETQLLGWLQRGANSEGLRIVILPGTHAKWALVRGGAVERFATAMTGELFDLLSRHSLLAAESDEDDVDAFDAGVAAAGDGGALAARLFSVRARRLIGEIANDHSYSFLSGLLIGAEIAALAPIFALSPHSGPLAVIGETAIAGRYVRALARRGFASETFDGGAAAAAGLAALWRSAA